MNAKSTAGSAGAAAVSLREVSFGYTPEQPLLSGISLEIPAGQWVALVGPNGCGKSTLVKLLNGLLPAASGQIEICGTPLEDKHVAEVRRRIGMVFQNPDNQFVGETVEEDILFGLEGLCLSRPEMEARLMRVTAEFELAPLLGKHPGELSGGQKQRVAIASILAMEPGIVIMDEASSMLDEAGRNALLAVLRKLHGEGYTVLMITHDAEEIRAAERVIALGGGGVAADRKPEELFADEGLLAACHLRAPYGWRLAAELKRLGIDAGSAAGGEELAEKLWPSN
ncbi:ATP-binding cassette domain-containing protein [Paenibacillus spiritus]|uniref:ATP-binding cassette domain-containing protein n=2 Tax=Paenibacillus TaxID=44249 RepID=A0A5J5G2F5_9BACL|nr:ATP-binding cassette domain-containing protein [Paenibacillus spiritus]